MTGAEGTAVIVYELAICPFRTVINLLLLSQIAILRLCYLLYVNDNVHIFTATLH